MGKNIGGCIGSIIAGGCAVPLLIGFITLMCSPCIILFMLIS